MPDDDTGRIPQARNDELYRSERVFRLLVEGVADYAIFMLDPDGVVANWNVGGQRIKGYSPDEIIGRHFSLFYTPADRDAQRPARSLRIARESGNYQEEGWRVRKDGSFFWASVVLHQVRSDDGDLIGFAKITRDITERREAQQKLEGVQRQLAESQKLDALGQLTGGVAHDFNNLLMVLAGSIPSLRRVADGDARAERAVQALEMVTQRGGALTSQLLSFARRQRVNPRIVRLAECIASIRNVLQAGLGSAYTLDTDLALDVAPVKVDATELETALVNLVVNARDAMPGGGVVRISARNTRLDEPQIKGDFVAIAVTDAGGGIPPDVIDKVFDPFFTTKQVGKGTGLGLSQVHGFAYQAGGSVRIDSRLGLGTTVCILLPQAGPADAGDRDREYPPGRVGNVLLVEDNPDVAFASTALLEQLGYCVNWTADADAALNEFARSHYDLVVSDIVMPGRLDGVGLARAIRERSPETPILLATGYAHGGSGLIEFPVLRKPFQIHDLSKALSDLSRRPSADPLS